MNSFVEFEKMINSSSRILITSHISPDPDAVCSLLLLGTSLKLNFPNKKIEMVLEEKPDADLSFLTGYKDIKLSNLVTATESFQPDLFIILDAMNFGRVARTEAIKLKELVTEKIKSKFIIIDHHTEIGLEKSDLYINQRLSSTSQQIYETLFNNLKLQKPEGFANTTLLGIIADTGRFLYKNPNHRHTFSVVSELIDTGASVEDLENRLERYNKEQLIVYGNLISNITDSKKGYTYSFIDDEVSHKADSSNLKVGAGRFTDQFLRNYEENYWGFVVYPEIVEGKKTYSVSFRSLGGYKNVAEIAQKLGGGGHEPAAGAKGIMASDAKSATKFVQSVIDDTK